MTVMRPVLNDIQTFIRAGVYRNKEQIRLSLVPRILQELGWNIWDPTQVRADYVPAAKGSQAVDMALFANSSGPSVIVVVEAVGDVRPKLRDLETRLRNHYRIQPTQFSIITTGREWRFYYSQAGGSFSETLLCRFDLLNDNLDDIERSFSLFLSKACIESGQARQEAEHLALYKRIGTAVDAYLPEAFQAVNAPPFPRLPESLAAVFQRRGINVSKEQLESYLTTAAKKQPEPPTPRVFTTPKPYSPARRESQIPEPAKAPDSSSVKRLNPENPGDVTYTKIIAGKICDEYASHWNELVEIGVRHAIQRGFTVAELNRRLTVNLQPGAYDKKGYRLIEGTQVSMQRIDANKAGKNLFRLAKLLKSELFIDLEWQEKSRFAGQRGLIEWKP
jgi:hypothetical protein